MINSGLLLAQIPAALRDPLIQEYVGICVAYAEGRWKLASLDAGRFCEVAYTVINGMLTGVYPDAPQKPGNFVQACRSLESLAPLAVGDRSIRILIPRLLPSLYEVRNNRNVGHVGGDVVSNKMDATLVREAAAWIVAELIRVTHQVSIEEAQSAVDVLAERVHPLVWEVDGVKRVLDPSLSAAKKVLILLYATPGWVKIGDARAWVKYGGGFRARVLEKLFKDCLIEIKGDSIMITPYGARLVEQELISKH
ncbi:hypothetical protein [Stenotrophomonas sp. PS02289]|uniref:hypothetical protein n=1 Tax=Stenotrophomonas sp. PS02289 TaxID=2991422 RepID=UPI00249B16C4|nr:hypothetical protein [Stenotrophomonas sp. PS02289]